MLSIRGLCDLSTKMLRENYSCGAEGNHKVCLLVAAESYTNNCFSGANGIVGGRISLQHSQLSLS